MEPNGIIRERLEMYPGIATAPLSYVAIGTCPEGSGDPYFVKVTCGEDPPLVRIPHEGLEHNLSFTESAIEVARPILSDFFPAARLG
jgi:hypothetical protein